MDPLTALFGISCGDAMCGAGPELDQVVGGLLVAALLAVAVGIVCDGISSGS